MSRFSTLTALLGTFCLVAAFALALPGVEIARADAPAPGAEREEFDRFLEQGGQRALRVPGSTCEDRAAGGPSGGQLAAERIARIQRELAARLAAGHGPPDEAPKLVPLNGRGYGYNTAQPRVALDPDRLSYESQRR